jgi:hypothetical protein
MLLLLLHSDRQNKLVARKNAIDKRISQAALRHCQEQFQPA